LASFFTLLYFIRVRREDQLWWSPSHKGNFDVRSFYEALACKEVVHFLWKSIWRTKVPLKVAFFVWSAALRKILTLDNLRKRRVVVIDICCMCKMNRESVDHLLLHCEVARALWNAIFGRFSLSWVIPLQVVDLFACWWMGGRSQSVVVWKMVHSCLLWCLCRERNDRHFEEKERTIEELLTFFFFSLFSWTATFLAPLVISFNDFPYSFFFPFLAASLVYSLCTSLRFAFFNDIILTYQNKNKNMIMFGMGGILWSNARDHLLIFPKLMWLLKLPLDLVKGSRELLNLNCSINYDAKGVSSRRGKGKAYAC
jgi:hypothetical protein